MNEPIKVLMLGAPGVGKTCIVQQFVCNEFHPDDYTPTDTKRTYVASVIYNDRLFTLQIVDLPVIPYFPQDSLFEWSDYRSYGLRSASAYVLVFDLNQPETFQYVKSMREQILDARPHGVFIIVVGNKHDLGDPREHREVAQLVKKYWRCAYVECSAKYNWHVVALFREIARAFENRDQNAIKQQAANHYRNHHHHHHPSTSGERRRRRRCTIM